MTITQRQVHLGFWLVLGPAIVVLAALALVHRPVEGQRGMAAGPGTGAAGAGVVLHER